MKRDKEADKAFGWILEMYAFAISSGDCLLELCMHYPCVSSHVLSVNRQPVLPAAHAAQAPGGPIKYDLHPEWMAQPPFDVHYKVRASLSLFS